MKKFDEWSYQTAWRYLERQVEHRNLSVLGEVPGANGRGQKVYGTKCKGDNLLHEVDLSAILVHFEIEGWDWCRGQSVDPRFRADADIRRYGHVFRLELDRDTKRRRALQEQLDRYRNTPDFVLFVVPRERRLREIKEVGAFLGEQLLCTTFQKASKDVFADIWEDIHGQKTSL